MILITKVTITKAALRELASIPSYLLDKFEVWVKTIEEIGLEEARKIPGYHDEPLKGKRRGQRSVRLNRSYRAIYRIIGDSAFLVEVIEVNKHEY